EERSQRLRSSAGAAGMGETDEPWPHQAARAGGHHLQERGEPPQAFHPLGAQAARRGNFLRPGPPPAPAAVVGAGTRRPAGRLRQAAATEERVRLSRDLHDGVLQSLTGAALKLETAQRLLDKQPAAARQRLAEIQHLIADEQRNLRFFIRDGTLDPLSAAAGDMSLETRLRLMAQRLEDVWGLRVG